MLQTLTNAWKVPELRKKILFTLFIIIVFRIGTAIPVPFLDLEVLQSSMATIKDSGTILSYFNALSGGAFENATIFAMGITPYINSSIIIQLLTVAIPPLERLAKEGEEGRKKIAQYTRYTTIILGLIQGTAYFFFLKNSNVTKYSSGWPIVFSAFVIILTFTAGTALMMWLGEQINQYGIGNGISILLFAGIISGTADAIGVLVQAFNLGLKGTTKYLFIVPLSVVILLGMVVFIIFMDNAERKIPIQYAKRMVGRKMYGGQSSYIPVKVNMSGVMPVIFASSILSIPGTIKFFKYGRNEGTSIWYKILAFFDMDKWPYAVLFFILILAFAYFYVTIQYNPIEMANNLRKNNGAIPGIRPGKPTSDYIAKIIMRITLIGALFLSVVAILPILLQYTAGNKSLNLSIGGTSILIVVGVALETVRQIESQMVMRHHKGFLE